MVRVEQHLVYATPTTPPFVYQQSDDLWRSPRGTVLRIQALALVAITLSFFLVVFGSCRRWSNRWIVQKGFSAAQVLSLSLGTYSIGLMQSSSVKSELYPVWAVSLLTLLGCLDPVATYIGLDYKGPLLKVIFQLCLYTGYVLLMSASTTSGLFGNIAIGVLSAITFIKGFHRSLALVLPSRMRNKLKELGEHTECGALEEKTGQQLVVHLPVHRSEEKALGDITITMLDIRSSFKDETDDDRHKKTNSTTRNDSLKKTNSTMKKVCLGYSLSHLLRRRFLGMITASQLEERRKQFDYRPTNSRTYKKTLKAVEVELAFLYEVFFTSNEFLYYYEAKTSSFWALASFVGICLVGIATIIPGTMASRYYHHRNSTFYSTGPSAATSVTVVVNTTTADLAITLVILASLALLQLVQLMGCWTSNWARVAFACECERNRKEEQRNANDRSSGNKQAQLRWTTRLKAFVVSSRMKWFDKYLWQAKLGQYSAVVAAKNWREAKGCCILELECCCLRMDNNNQHETAGCAKQQIPFLSRAIAAGGKFKLDRLTEMLGFQYIKQALEESLWSAADIKRGAGVRLHKDVKTCVAEFLSQMKGRSSKTIWTGLEPLIPRNKTMLAELSKHLPYSTDALKMQDGSTASAAVAFTYRVMVSAAERGAK